MATADSRRTQVQRGRPGPFTVLPSYRRVFVRPGDSQHRTFPRPVLLVILLLVLATLACSIEYTTVHIENPRLYREPSREANATRNFNRDNTIYCIVDVKDVKDDPVTVRIVWYQILVDEETEDETVVEIGRQQFIVTHNQELIFPRIPPADAPEGEWARGPYRVKLWIDGDHDATIDFKVK